MSSIGKFFVLLNFGLSFLFLGWAANVVAKGDEFRTKYEKEVSAHEGTRSELETNLSSVRAQVQQEQTAKDTLRSERDQKEALASRTQSELAESKRRIDQLTSDVTKISETLDGYRQAIESMTQAKDQAIQEARDADAERIAATQARDDAETARRDAEEAQRSAEARIADLETELATSRKEISSLNAKVSSLVSGGPGGGEMGQPQIEAMVLSVDRSFEPGLVALNKGEQDNVQRGYVFEIYNGNQYKGQVRVTNVLPSMCSGLIIRTVPGTQMGQGDKAATHL